ncbi:hypothetical protein GGI04_006052 [Coemansia thaxteri]|nr:hypothetical protein GGI04_006052 [Coemansia thaxteri]
MADRGWACGYRNCQMLISSVMRSVHGSSLGALLVPPRMPAERVPPVRELQEMLELSWRDGFDCDGADQLDHRVMGTRKWIGTTEIYCILAHLGVRAHIVDFHCPTAPDRSHPALFSWIIEYFTAAPPPALLAGDQADDSLAGEAAGSGGAVRFAARHPLYLQHQGHSRTVVGVELADDATYLLVFDPDVNAAANPARFRMPIARTRGTRQFQILYVDHADCCPPAVPKQIVSRRIP